jgi:hypothetical protein
MKTSKTFVTMIIVALALAAGGVQRLNAQAPNGNGRWSSGFGGLASQAIFGCLN